MAEGFWIAGAIVLGVVVWVLVKVVYYARLSRKQWEAVDRSKLREWDDEDD